MKTVIIFLITTSCLTLQAQSKLPSTNIQTLEGTTFNTADISNKGKPIILFFWGSYCHQSQTAFNNISEVYADWQEETGVKLVAVAIDNTRSQSKVSPMVNSKGWELEFYIDQNQEFKRAMIVSQCPHIFLLDNNGNIVWQGAGYIDGQENDIYTMVQKISKGETLK